MLWTLNEAHAASMLNQWKKPNRVSIIESCVAFAFEKNQKNDNNHFENFADDERQKI